MMIKKILLRRAIQTIEMILLRRAIQICWTADLENTSTAVLRMLITSKSNVQLISLAAGSLITHTCNTYIVTLIYRYWSLILVYRFWYNIYADQTSYITTR